MLLPPPIMVVVVVVMVLVRILVLRQLPQQLLRTWICRSTMMDPADTLVMVNAEGGVWLARERSSMRSWESQQ